ncbi:MAG: 4-hydroxythreonine-4-phosphate dehydrogenase PdxA [Deltaproteobacteria bacterium]|nr:4-hydroxythreonine-4-phosphate dehydrogenase PdxA [Deltaproteobacteria bacterium]
MGDPLGIGPEVIAKSLHVAESVARPILVGVPDILRDAIRQYGGESGAHRADEIEIVAPSCLAGDSPAARGRLQAECIEIAVAMTMRGESDAIVTAPSAKSNFDAAGIRVPGQTELIARRCGAPTPVMMLAGEKLRVVPLTTHCPVVEVPSRLSIDSIVRQLRVIDADLRRWFGIERVRIALTGLNPHAGEGGMFGCEEIEILAPAAALARAEGIDVTDPQPADTAFHFAVHGRYDVVVSPTHDQALIPLKLLHFDDGVNLTLGLPFPRTSPDHGTAPDIAGRGVANPASMIAAIRTAVAMTRRGRGVSEREA